VRGDGKNGDDVIARAIMPENALKGGRLAFGYFLFL
jgi:hypothetical protein